MHIEETMEFEEFIEGMETQETIDKRMHNISLLAKLKGDKHNVK